MKRKFASIMDTPPMDSAVAFHCELAQVGDEVKSKYWAIVMQKESSLKHAVNQEMIQLMEQGILDYLDHQWLYGRRSKLCKQFKPSDGFDVEEVSSVGGAFLLYGQICLASGFIFLIELLAAFHLARRFYTP